MDLGLLLILVVISIVVSVTLVNILSVTVYIKKSRERKKRRDQLVFKDERDVSVEEALEKITDFVETYIYKQKKSPQDELMEIRLKMIEFDKYFGAREWRAFSIFMAIVGVILALIFSMINVAYGIVTGIILIAMPQIYYMSQVKEVRVDMLSKFPKIIILINGYLAAGYTLEKAVRATIPFAGKRWEKELVKFVTDIDLLGVEHALNNLKRATDIPEVREFCSLVKVAYEQGSVGSSFEDQAIRMESIQNDVMKQKIEGRKSLTILAQGPTLLAVFILAGAPVLKQVTEITQML